MQLSISTFFRAKESLKIPLKRSNRIIDHVYDAERLELRHRYATIYLTQIPLYDIKNIFVDESGFSLHMRRIIGRSAIRSRVSITVPAFEGRNTTFICKINSYGVVHYKILQGSCNGERFSIFFLELDFELTHEMNKSDDKSLWIIQELIHQIPGETSLQLRPIEHFLYPPTLTC